MPIGGARPHHAKGPLGVPQLHGVMISRSEPVLQHERRDAQRIQPLRDLRALVIQGQVAVPAPGTDHHRGARPPARRHMNRDSWLVGLLGSQRPRRRPAPQRLHRRPPLGQRDRAQYRERQHSPQFHRKSSSSRISLSTLSAGAWRIHRSSGEAASALVIRWRRRPWPTFDIIRAEAVAPDRCRGATKYAHSRRSGYSGPSLAA